MKHILIAEDHKIVRLGTIMLLETLFPGIKISEAETFDNAIQLVADHPDADLLILDINIPGGDSINMIQALRLRRPGLRILIFSGYNESLYALHYVQSGANGYLSKDATDQEFKTAVSKVLNNETYLSPAVFEQQLIDKFQGGRTGRSGTASLSIRELEIMQLLLKGSGTKEIATLLNLQLSTVSTYKARIYEKLGVTNIMELAEKVRMDNHH